MRCINDQRTSALAIRIAARMENTAKASPATANTNDNTLLGVFKNSEMPLPIKESDANAASRTCAAGDKGWSVTHGVQCRTVILQRNSLFPCRLPTEPATFESARLHFRALGGCEPQPRSWPFRRPHHVRSQPWQSRWTVRAQFEGPPENTQGTKTMSKRDIKHNEQALREHLASLGLLLQPYELNVSVPGALMLQVSAFLCGGILQLQASAREVINEFRIFLF